jgi:eukaryotic-like serine/threonine-protein kinase
MTTLIGRNVGSYRVLAKTRLGESGFVYKALHVEKRQTYGLKLLRGTLSAEDPSQRRILDRLQIGGTLDHPHIARVYAIETADDFSIVPLEFVYGQSVSEKIVEGACAADSALRIALQTAEALQSFHAENAPHGRLTSNNLILCSDEQVKVFDFGFESIPEEMLFSEPENGLTGSLIPSRPPLSRFAYQAPEQIQGGAPTAQTDLFSLGVILYELLAGEFLFEGTDRGELFHQIESRELPKISEVRPGIGAGWTKILRALLEKKPANRYPSALRLLEDLRKLNYGIKLDRLSFQTSQPPLSRRSFFRRFLGEVEE